MIPFNLIARLTRCTYESCYFSCEFCYLGLFKSFLVGPVGPWTNAASCTDNSQNQNVVLKL
jgi:hypothetical protein